MKHDGSATDLAVRPMRSSRIAWVTAVALLAVAWGSSQLRAEDPLPTGEEILDKYVEVTGGKAAYAKLRTRVVKGTLEMVGQGMKGNMETYNARPYLLYASVSLDAFGKSEHGVNGDIVWQLTPVAGPEIKEGAERTLMLREALFDADVRWRKLYKEAKCVGTETRDGKTLYKVILTPTEGNDEIHYFDKESHLRVYLEMKLQTAMGMMPVTAAISDYRRVDGILVPFQTREKIMGIQEIVTTTESVRHNVDIPPDRFNLPPEIQALVRKREANSRGAGKAGRP